ncbi:MAG: hypothetical protein ACKOC0_09105, partial [Cytophagales bacterium]
MYEISSLSKDEKMIEQIYQKQLEAILFSVNQISDATVNSWMSKVSISQNEEVGESAISPSLNTLLTLNPAIQAAFMVDSTHEKATIQLYTLDTARSAKSKNLLTETLAGSTVQIRQLLKYTKSGFQKIETIPSNDPPFQS